MSEISSRYEQFLLERNQYDQMIGMAPYCGDLLEAAARRYVCALGAPKTAAALYRLADIIAVKGIDDTVEEPKKIEVKTDTDDLKKKHRALVRLLTIRIAALVATSVLAGAVFTLWVIS